MSKEKYNKIINSNITFIGQVILAIQIILLIILPILVFPLTGVLIYDILLSMLIIVTTITVIGFTIFSIVHCIIWHNNIKGYHKLSLECMCLIILTHILNNLSFIILYWLGDWRR